MKDFDYLVFIGRFNPLHNGHLHVIEKALKLSEHVIIVIGSSFAARSPYNPFTFEERSAMVGGALPKALGRLSFAPVPDVPYNDTLWSTGVVRAVNHITGNAGKKVGLVGYSKDHTSFYLKMFPQWKSVNVESQFSTLNASDMRREYFQDYWRLPTDLHCPENVVKFLTSFAHSETFKWLVAENKYNKAYDPRVFDNDIVACVDNCVIQSGHILLVERGKHPGKGLLALPGGHVEKKERFKSAAIRELREETHIADEKGELPPAMLESFIKHWEFFDDPNRSQRARVTSMCYFYRLPSRTKLFKVLGDDDAASARWYNIADLDPEKFFEDHYHMIQIMLNKEKH